MERSLTTVTNAAAMSSEAGLQALSRVWAINRQATADLMSLSSEGLRRWMELSQRYARDLAERPAPARLVRLNAEYLQSIINAAWEDAGKRAEVLMRAASQLASATTTATASATASATAPATSSTTEAVRQPEVAGETLRDMVEAADDDLQQIVGIGAVMARQLRSAGITTIAELAALDVETLKDDAHPLRPLAGRIVADEWVEQARELAGLPGA